MLRNIKYIFASVPFMQYRDYKIITDYTKCDYDSLKMLNDKEHIAKTIKMNSLEYSHILSCSKKGQFESLITLKSKKINDLYIRLHLLLMYLYFQYIYFNIFK